MGEFFAWNYRGAPFELFGPAHITGLLLLLALNLYVIRFKDSPAHTKHKLRWTLALILWGNEIAWHSWWIVHGTWSYQTMLPLQICSLMVWLSGLMLVTRSYRIYEFSYFLGIGGALQALATPDLGIYGFPHFRFFQTFLSHGLIITAAITMTVAEGFHPTWKSMLRAALWMNVYMVAIYFFNDAIGSNYLMINGKPDVPSLLDLLPPWPWYILWMEMIGALTFLCLYLPFIWKDWHRKPYRKNA
jgi:hypothetical integral membrane protein (TIGR02206 family)